MAIAAGTLSVINNTQGTTVQLETTQASGGVAPYFVQWYRDTSGTGFTPGVGNILTGKTSLSLKDETTIPNTLYYYKVVYTDSTPDVEGVDAAQTVTSTALTVTTSPKSLSQNQFNMEPYPGMVDLNNGSNNIVSAKIDDTQTADLYVGARVYTISDDSGIPSVASLNLSTAPTGFIVYDQKSQAYKVGDRCEIARDGVCMWMYSTTAIVRDARVILDNTSLYAVKALDGTGKPIVGRAFDRATAPGQLIRVMIGVPSSALDS